MSFKCHCRSILKLIIPVILQVNVFIFVSINEFTLSRFLNMASKDIHSLSFNQRECESAILIPSNREKQAIMEVPLQQYSHSYQE